MSDESPCSVRAEVREMVDREIGHLRELIERTTAEKAVALDLQRDEYHRRLNELNHAHALAAEAVRMTVPRETFDVFVRNYAEKHAELVAEITNIKAVSATNARMFIAITAVIGLAISAIALWIKVK